MGGELGGAGGEFSAGGEISTPSGGETALPEAPSFHEGADAAAEFEPAPSNDLGQSELPEPSLFEGETFEAGDVAEAPAPSADGADASELDAPGDFDADAEVSEESAADRSADDETFPAEQSGETAPEAAELPDGENVGTIENPTEEPAAEPDTAATAEQEAPADPSESSPDDAGPDHAASGDEGPGGETAETREAAASEDGTAGEAASESEADAATADEGAVEETTAESEADAEAAEEETDEATVAESEADAATADEGAVEEATAESEADAEAAEERTDESTALDDADSAELENPSPEQPAEAERQSEAERYGRTEAEYEDLARDPDIGGKITDKTIQEREAALGVEQRDGLGKLTRDRDGGDFVEEGSGQQWDIKTFNSNFPPDRGGFELQTDADKVDKDLGLGENVIVDTRNMNEQDIDTLKVEGDRRGWGDRVRWWP